MAGRSIVVARPTDRWLLGNTTTGGDRVVVGFQSVMTPEGPFGGESRTFQVLGVELGGRAVNALYGLEDR